ncbi:hypothetical protein ACS0TY_016301 [Phlomoides rotata]
MWLLNTILASHSPRERKLLTSTWDCMMFQLPPLTFGKEFTVAVEATQVVAQELRGPGQIRGGEGQARQTKCYN